MDGQQNSKLVNGHAHANGMNEASSGKQIVENGHGHLNGTIDESVVGPDGSREISIPVAWGYISAKTYGDPSCSPILAVHGWMDNAGTFDRLIPLLPKSFYIVAVDLPGHGLSSHIPQGLPYHYTDFLIAVRRLTKAHFKWEKFAWLGHSMGAGIGALYASIFPAQVERLVMLDLVMPITGESGDDYAKKMSIGIDQFLALEEKIQPIPPSYESTDAVDRLVKATRNSLTSDSAKILLKRGSRLNKDEKFSFTRDLRLRSPSILRFSRDQCFSLLSEIRCPLLIVKAKDAPWFEAKEVCLKAIDIYKQHCSSFEFAEFDGNHFIHLNEPEKIAETVSRFFLEQRSVL
jgi:pimeloyl-ACP methyl ester carboxylesterase